MLMSWIRCVIQSIRLDFPNSKMAPLLLFPPKWRFVRLLLLHSKKKDRNQKRHGAFLRFIYFKIACLRLRSRKNDNTNLSIYYLLLRTYTTPENSHGYPKWWVAGRRSLPLKMAIVVRFLGCRFTSSLRSSLSPLAAPGLQLLVFTGTVPTKTRHLAIQLEDSQLACKSFFARCFLGLNQRNGNSQHPLKK